MNGVGPRVRGPNLKGKVLAAAALAALFVVIVAPAPASAFWANQTSCGKRTSAQQTFSNDYQWSLTDVGYNTFRYYAEQAFVGWRNETRSWAGGYALSTTSGDTFNWRWDDLGSIARVTCGLFGTFRNVEFNKANVSDFQGAVIDFAGVAWHEAGHVWGINHSGRYDSFEANPPTMASCSVAGNGSARRNLSQDDEAAVQFLTDVSGSFRSATANSSFEEGVQWWAKSSQASEFVYVQGGGVDGSSRYGRFKSGGTSSYIFSTTRYIEGWTASLKGRANYRRHQSSDVGHVLVVTAWRRVEYATSADTCWNTINGARRRLDSPTILDDFSNHWYQKTCYPGTSWGYCDTAWSDVSANSSATAIDVRIYVYNRMQTYSGGPYTYVHVDRVRVMIDD